MEQLLLQYILLKGLNVKTMKIYSYLVEHDYGLAPNPFGKYCTLVVCKPKIRKSRNLKLGDWIIGTGSKALEHISSKKLVHHLIYAMQVCEIIPMDDYWNDQRFQYKKPVINGPLVAMYGDNFYHKDKSGKWIQEDSAHSSIYGAPNEEHVQIDVGGENALIGELFYYFGDSAPLIPESIRKICHSGIGEKILAEDEGCEFLQWLTAQFSPGINGDPNNWIEYQQKKIF